ncbi:MAG: hypothetical protein KME47_19970 [Nodosilinea sp. WJT8-NPBG4]|jgi:hypothetical protein|nr:hypothetical protein [Nodosilinea sp. WJT8-NPBG4]
MPNALSLIEDKIRAVKGENTLSLEYQLVTGRMAGRLSIYKEFAYTGTNLTGIAVWDGPEKETHLLSISLSYTGTNLTQKTVTDKISGNLFR